MKLAKPAYSKSEGPILVIGNGMVGHRFCRAFRSLDSETPILAIGAEPTAAYDRVNLTKLVSDADPDSLSLSPADWYARHQVELRTGVRVTAVDPNHRTVTTDQGEILSYGTLVIASGSVPWIPPIPGADGTRVFPYRTIEDVVAAVAEGRFHVHTMETVDDAMALLFARPGEARADTDAIDAEVRRRIAELHEIARAQNSRDEARP